MYENRNNSVGNNRYLNEPSQHVVITNDLNQEYIKMNKNESISAIGGKSLYFGSQRDFDPTIKQDVYQIALKQLNDERKSKFSPIKKYNKAANNTKSLNKVG